MERSKGGERAGDGGRGVGPLVVPVGRGRHGREEGADVGLLGIGGSFDPAAAQERLVASEIAPVGGQGVP